MGRVALSKMVLLPRCLYALQNYNCLIPRSTFTELNSLLVSLVWAGKRNRVKLEVLKLDLEQGGLGLPDLQMYYLSELHQHATHWGTSDPNREKRLLAGVVAAEELPALLMDGGSTCRNNPFIVQQVAMAWKWAVTRVLRRAPYAKLLPLAWLKPFRQI